MKKIIGCILKADKEYSFIENGDLIGVGISGGKDSMLMLYALSIYRKVSLKMLNKKFDIVAIHLDMNFEGMDFSLVDAFCEANNIKIHHEKTKIFDILNLNKKNDKIQCSLCSTLKKGAVNRVAKELGCTKVAFGHHADDAVETLIMNAIYCGKIATFKPKMHLTNIDITFIRPLVYVYESDIKKAYKKYNIPIVESTCPNEGNTKRSETKELLESLYKEYPIARSNFLHMLSNNENVELWDKEIEENLN